MSKVKRLFKIFTAIEAEMEGVKKSKVRLTFIGVASENGI